jgi:hypothetical protein
LCGECKFSGKIHTFVVYYKRTELMMCWTVLTLIAWYMSNKSLNSSFSFRFNVWVMPGRSHPRGTVVKASGAKIWWSLRRGLESHCGTLVPVFLMRPYKPRSRVAVGVAR